MKKFFATYIVDTNPNSGAFAYPVETNVVRDLNYNVILKETFDEMFDYCKSIIEQDILHLPAGSARWVETEKGLALLDYENYQILRYDIQEINL